MAKSLEKMSHQELEKLRTDVDAALMAAKKRDKKEARKAAEAAAAEYGFTLAELMGGSGGKSSGKGGVAKYANPENPSQTWTGKGRQPKWYKDAMAAGTDPATLEV
ncbi:H-NS histone family protein [uncultured Tateyamaria sp.]|uniref:H-NS histone family protein n=1 Tax=Tateyamaria sp. 1078 TaxID=3417464 RepID=UPI002612B68B|nr:H-NS histone family protein [uncultured Tateyamaria sp.]